MQVSSLVLRDVVTAMVPMLTRDARGREGSVTVTVALVSGQHAEMRIRSFLVYAVKVHIEKYIYIFFLVWTECIGTQRFTGLVVSCCNVFFWTQFLGIVHGVNSECLIMSRHFAYTQRTDTVRFLFQINRKMVNTI